MKGWIPCKQRKVGFCGRHNIRGHTPTNLLGPSWPWTYGSWIYNYLCNQYVSPLMWVWILFRARCTTLCDKVCQWLATGRCFSPGPPNRHDITEILLNVALNTIKQTNKPNFWCFTDWESIYGLSTTINRHVDILWKLA
jgi:hypothetical protein